MDKRFRLKKRMVALMTLCFATCILFMGTAVSAQAATKNWSVYGQQGAYRQQQIISIVNHGNGYVAKCNNASGNAASKQTRIREYSDRACRSEVTLNKTVLFTTAGTSISFKHMTMPAVDTVYMKVNLTYSNGSSASMSGTISTN